MKAKIWLFLHFYTIFVIKLNFNSEKLRLKSIIDQYKLSFNTRKDAVKNETEIKLMKNLNFLKPLRQKLEILKFD